MADEIVFYTNPMSRGRTARWMLEEVGRPYRTEIMDWGPKPASVLALNPMGKVPTIVHAGQVVTESAAICAYLADAFPEAGLAPPPGDPARGAYYRWLFFASGPFEAAITDRYLGVQPEPKHRPMLGYGSLETVLDTLERVLDGTDYLAGGRFSAADLYVGAQLDFQMSFKTIEERPAFRRYVDRLLERPARRRAAEIDDALIAAKQQA